MKNFAFRRQLVFVVFMLLGCLTIHAVDDDLITEQITIKLETSGTLPDKISDSDKYKITNLKIIGDINGTDLRLLRDMAGRDCLGDSTAGKLAVLDLKDTKIVSGGDTDYYTEDNMLGAGTFSGCHSLTNIDIPSEVTYIGTEAFSGCGSLTNVTIPSSVTKIDKKAFYRCSNLAVITIPYGISFGSMLFFGCHNLKECNFIMTTDLGTYISKGCKNLLPGINGLKDINIRYLFDGKEITNLEIPSDVTSIAENTFWGCKSLTSVTIPSSVKSIKSSAFKYCTGLTTVTIPSSVTLESNAFLCSKIDMLNYEITTDIATYLTSGKTPRDRFMQSDVSVFNYLMNGKAITNIEIPDTILSIREKAFYGCKSLTCITIPSSVTVISDSAFYDCSSLSDISIPSSVKNIGIAAFMGCSSLQSINIPSSIIWRIQNSTFKNCSSLQSISIPSSVEEIYDGAFSGCISLQRISIPSGVKEIYGGAFSGCSSLQSISLPSGIKNINNYTFSGCSSLQSISLPSSVEKIYMDAFSGCSSLQSITIPYNVYYIGDFAFWDCSSLKSVYVSWDYPIGISVSTFGFSNDISTINTIDATLHVPQGTLQYYRYYIYRNTWGRFKNIVEYDVTGVDNVSMSNDVKETARYGADGQRLEAPVKGLNIVRYSDGSVRKIAVQ